MYKDIDILEVKFGNWCNIVKQIQVRTPRYPSKNEYAVWVGIGSAPDNTTKFGRLTKIFTRKADAIKYAKRLNLELICDDAKDLILE